MTTDKLLKARQVENIIKPLIQRRERELAKNKAYPQGIGLIRYLQCLEAIMPEGG